MLTLPVLSRSRLLLSIALALSAWLGAAPALATPIAFTGTLSLRVRTTSGSAPSTIAVPGAGIAQVSPGPHVGSLALPGGAFSTTNLTVPVTDPLVHPVKGMGITVQNAGGTLAGSGGTLPLVGVARLCLFAACPAPIATAPIPLAAVGVGGLVTAMGAVNVTVVGAPWQTGMVTHGAFITTVATGFAHGPASATSSTAAASGVLRLVSPVLISTSLGPSLSPWAGFAILDLHFVPEPGTALLLTAGLLALGRVGYAAGRNGRRR
jgi:hypothetical protein